MSNSELESRVACMQTVPQLSMLMERIVAVWGRLSLIEALTACGLARQFGARHLSWFPMVPQDNSGFSGESRHRPCGIKQALVVPPFIRQRQMWEMIIACSWSISASAGCLCMLDVS